MKHILIIETHQYCYQILFCYIFFIKVLVVIPFKQCVCTLANSCTYKMSVIATICSIKSCIFTIGINSFAIMSFTIQNNFINCTTHRLKKHEYLSFCSGFSGCIYVHLTPPIWLRLWIQQPGHLSWLHRPSNLSHAKRMSLGQV